MILEHFYLGKPKPEGPITATTPLRFVKAYTEQYKPIRVELELPVAPVLVLQGEHAHVRLNGLRIAVYEVAGHDAFTLMDPAFWGRLRFDVTARGPVRAAEAERQRFLAERIFDNDGRFDHWRQSLQVELAAGQQARVVYPVHTMVQVFELHGHGRAHAGARGGTGELGTGRFGDREWPTRQPMAVQRAGAYRFVKDWSPTRKVDTANVDEAGSHPPPLYLEVSPPSPPYRRVADFSDPDVEVVAHGPDFAGLGNTLRPYVEAWAEMLVREFLAWQLPVAPLGEPE